MTRVETRRTAGRAIAVLAGMLITGCAGEDRVVFVTDTTLGLSVEQVPGAMSLAYGRIEGVEGPMLPDGQMPGVYASIQSGGGLFDRRIRQVYATGNAASLISGEGAAAGPASRGAAAPGTTRYGFFGTETVLGFKVGTGLGGGSAAAPGSLLLGFKRREASVLPLSVGSDVVYPATVAAIDTTVQDGTQDDDPFSVIQFFATGEAAINLAADAGFRGKFRDWAEPSALRAYAPVATGQAEAVKGIFACYTRLPASRLTAVWQDAADRGLMGQARLAQITGILYGSGTPPGYDALTAANERYAASLTAPADFSDPQVVATYDQHRDHVCAQAGAS